MATATFTRDDLAALTDLIGSTYVLRDPQGHESAQAVASAVSVRALTQAVDNPGGNGKLDPGLITWAAVFDDNGTAHELDNFTRQELGPAGANGFMDGLSPAVYTDGGDAHLTYIRPLRGPEDANNVAGSDNGYFPVAGDLRVDLHTHGHLLGLSVFADRADPQVSGPVDFSVQFDQEPNTALTYDWDFGDSVHSADPAPSHAWTTSGTYPVRLQVRGADGSLGLSDPVVITVGPTPSASPTPTPGSGVETQTPAPSAGPTKGNGHHSGGKPTKTSIPTAAGTTPAATTSAATAAAGAPGASTVPTTQVPAPTASATAIASPTPTPTPTGDQVQGTVLVAAGQPPQPVTPVDQPQQTAAAARGGKEEGSWGIPRSAGGVGLGVLLLGLGALAEARPGWWRRLTGRQGKIHP